MTDKERALLLWVAARLIENAQTRGYYDGDTTNPAHRDLSEGQKLLAAVQSEFGNMR